MVFASHEVPFGQTFSRPDPEAGHKRVWGWMLQTIKWELISKLWMRAFSQEPYIIDWLFFGHINFL